ncbi:DNA mismatch repair protein MutS [Candidatus Woesearchaeota archaeon]|jgi:DNA mismatch repair protein MutS|nr:DNA mismatch repair protein MutS [Candidatus Woesearchaeota archaeon]MBT5740266.1 DNA mismatch repair protein MutS [Candidatus Woesearchaeota archaeon]
MKEGKSILDIPTENLTPGMRQYQDAKRANPDCLILMRMGDFFEIFYEDAITAARELEITLTSRGKGERQAPLAGVPYHALDTYLGRLVKRGYKVAIVEQLEDPKQAKGLVKRGLVRIVTPGTVIASSLLNEKENNYLMSITANNNQFALACCDMSTGEFFTTAVVGMQALINELIRLQPTECVLPESLKVNQELLKKIQSTGMFMNTIEDYYFKTDKARSMLCNHFRLQSLTPFGLEELPQHTSVAGALLYYLVTTQKNNLSHLRNITVRSNQQTMVLDGTTYRNLELIKNIRDGSKRGTLLSVIDQTMTSLGARLLRKWVQAPLLQQPLIEDRLAAVNVLKTNVIVREELRDALKQVFDLERLIGKVNYGTASPKDLLALRNSLHQLPGIKQHLTPFQTNLLKQIRDMPDSPDIVQKITTAIRDDAPLTVREGGIIKSGYSEELDNLHALRSGSKNYLQELEEKEKKKTGISSLKIKYNRVFGYFIEITKKHLAAVPENYIRKQTTANAERYITEELKIEEEKILGAQEKIYELEYKLFQEIIKIVTNKTAQIQQAATRVSVLDVLCSFAKVALENNYIMPRFIGDNVIQIRSGRHPVVEQQEKQFIANDIFLNHGEMMIITGPNMAGKSTVMRQVALTVLMAQIGCFVPADDCVLGITDRIFTRVGASDDISSGQSTFMVEMQETANILHNATDRSLLILDEIGRGTSTFDGVSIAWSVAENIVNQLQAKTLFATHYHVMNKLANKFSRIKNYNIAVKEVGQEIVFMHKLLPGGTDQSYGIHVAELAGMPASVVFRAKEIQDILQREDDMMKKLQAKKLKEQMSLDGF